MKIDDSVRREYEMYKMLSKCLFLCDGSCVGSCSCNTHTHNIDPDVYSYLEKESKVIARLLAIEVNKTLREMGIIK